MEQPIHVCVFLGQTKSDHNNEVTVKAGFHYIHNTKKMEKTQKLIYKESKIKTKNKDSQSVLHASTYLFVLFI